MKLLSGTALASAAALASVALAADFVKEVRNVATRDGNLKIVVIGDTHSREFLKSGPGSIPDGDVLIHVGDLVQDWPIKIDVSEKDREQAQLANQASKDQSGETAEDRLTLVKQQLRAIENLRALKHKVKIIVPGNHDRVLDWATEGWKGVDDMDKKPWITESSRYKDFLDESVSDQWKEAVRKAYWPEKSLSAVAAGKEWRVLLHESDKFTVNGQTIKVFGSPISYRRNKSAFCIQPWDDKPALWEKILEEKPDIVITHGPPKDPIERLEVGDKPLDRDAAAPGRTGSPYLREAIEKAEIPLVMFGHIHTTGYGITHRRFPWTPAKQATPPPTDATKSGLLVNAAVQYDFNAFAELTDAQSQFWTPKKPITIEYNAESRNAQTKAGQVLRQDSPYPEYVEWSGPMTKPSLGQIKKLNDKTANQDILKKGLLFVQEVHSGNKLACEKKHELNLEEIKKVQGMSEAEAEAELKTWDDTQWALVTWAVRRHGLTRDKFDAEADEYKGLSKKDRTAYAAKLAKSLGDKWKQLYPEWAYGPGGMNDHMSLLDKLHLSDTLHDFKKLETY